MSDPCYSPRFDEALALAADAFRHQRRKATPIPYLSHLLQVTVWVAENGGDEDQLIAAVLHDYLEDVEGASGAHLEERFGARVRRLVEALSDSSSHPKPPWRSRKEAYLDRLRGEPAEVKLVSACDKLHNARSIVRDQRRHGDQVFERFTATKEDTLWYYDAVAVALGDGWRHDLVRELRDSVAQMRELAGNAGTTTARS